MINLMDDEMILTVSMRILDGEDLSSDFFGVHSLEYDGSEDAYIVGDAMECFNKAVEWERTECHDYDPDYQDYAIAICCAVDREDYSDIELYD